MVKKKKKKKKSPNLRNAVANPEGIRIKKDQRELFEKAVKLHNNGDLKNAEIYYRTILSNDPEHSDALNLMGLIAHQVGNNTAALSFTQQALNIIPDNADYLRTHATVLMVLNRVKEAISNFRKSLEFQPDHVRTWFNLGRAYQIDGNLIEAEKLYEYSISMDSEFYLSYCNLGAIYTTLEKYDDAIEMFNKCLSINNEHINANFNLGNVYMTLGKRDCAKKEYLKVLKVNPQHDGACNNLGIIYKSTKEYKLAVDMFNRKLVTKPFSGNTCNNLGTVLTAIGNIEEAILNYRKAMAIHPETHGIGSNLLMAMHYCEYYSPENIYNEHVKWGNRYKKKDFAGNYDFSEDRKIRIGFVSADFYRHSCSYFFEPLLKELNREKIEVFCYSDEQVADDMTERLKSISDFWKIISRMPDIDVLKMIKADQIDILIDLSGHTGINRLTVFAEKPAPVQFTWLGYPDTTGIKNIDYRITDKIADPENIAQKYNVEKLKYLKGGFLCYCPPETGAVVNYTPSENITFGSFNNTSKINKKVIKVWSDILLKVKNSNIILKSKQLSDQFASVRIIEFFAEFGIQSDRITLVKRTESLKEHLELYNKIDIALDPFPYSGTTTTFEALFMSVPVITLNGDRHSARVGASILHHIGHDELIADNLDEYISKAVELAGNKEKLVNYRSILSDDLKKSSLCDPVRFVNEFEDLLVDTWKTRCRSADSAKIDNLNDVILLPEKEPVFKTTKSGKIRIIHNMARSGGTLLCKCIGCMDKVSLLSEIHPFAMQMFNPLKQAKEWFGVFSDDDIKKISERTYIGFKEAIQIINRKCIDKGLTLVLRDWSHLDFTGLPFLKSPSYELLTAKVLKHDFEIINFCTVRHPIDQWLSFKNLGIMKEHLDLQAYLTGYRKFAEKCHEIGFIKYEDITRDPETGIKSLCEKLEIDYDPAFVDKWWQYTTITGDTNSQRGFKKEIKFMPRRPMEDGLLEKFENNEDYKKSIEILGYS